MNDAPSFDDIFAVMAAASVGNLAERVAVSVHPQLEHTATLLAMSLNVLLDDLALRSADAQRELTERQRIADRLRILAEAAQEFSAATYDYDRLLDLVARRIGDVAGDLCGVRMISEDGEWLEAGGAVYHRDPEMLALAREGPVAERQRVGEGMSGGVAATGQPLLISKASAAEFAASTEPKYRSFLERLGIMASIAVPLICRGKVLGVASLIRNSPNPYNDEDLGFIRSLADHAAIAIGNARSYAAERASHAAALTANQALHESREAHRLLFEASPLPLFVFDVETLAPLAVNGAALLLYGYQHDEFMALRLSDLTVDGHDAVRARVVALAETAAAGTSHYRRKDGSRFFGEYTTRALSFAGRRARISVIKDITERHEAEQTRALLAAIVQSSNDAIISRRLDGTMTSWNDAAERLFGYTAQEALGQPLSTLVPSDKLEEERTLLRRIAEGDRIDRWETVRRRKDGSLVAVSISLAPILDASGKVVGASKTARDLTAERGAEEALRRTEGQLRQAQKMEAVGRLAGGVAHDFNNVLSVILSYAEMLLAEMKPGESMRDDVEEIGKAGKRAADLTQQLLMFSRQQVLAPKVLDLNDVLTSMDKMLQRILGADVDLVSRPAQPLGRVLVDPSNIEQVIMNLVVNARDAMPTGGKLTMETDNVVLDELYAREHLGVKAGPHVMLAVSDTGTGIDRATMTRIFEPFFTTKEAGKGTGLGLSTVFGIVQQNGGSIWVYSELGKGTTFKVYLPRVDRAVDVVRPVLALTTLRGSETILLVEDDDQVRTVARGILGKCGYQVVEARNAGEALLHSEKHQGVIDLLLTDVVMPQMSGPELANRLASARPDMKVLCMSGYTDDSIVRHGVLEARVAYLQKPITPEALTRKVREVLESPKGIA
ncbi:MAG TPA: PAS domain S-box protein [Polyangiaceae bacterium]|nr:PAS domain S-box protein [Polyangiaceae bacterium]